MAITEEQVQEALENEFDGLAIDCVVREILELREQRDELLKNKE